MASIPRTPFIHYSMDDDGQVHLVMHKEIWNALQAAQVSKDQEGFVKVSLTKATEVRFSSILGLPDIQQPPCPPAVRKE